VKFEHTLRIQGKYNDYVKQLKIKNRLTHINEIENLFLNLANESNKGYISEQGEVERWVGGLDKEKFISDITKASNEARKKVKKELTSEE
jgi:uncharacterized membrane-anchored protein